jgi:hypothetical protein
VVVVSFSVIKRWRWHTDEQVSSGGALVMVVVVMTITTDQDADLNPSRLTVEAYHQTSPS